MADKLRQIEKKIIVGLEKDSRMPFSKLGKSVRASQQRVSYIVASLMKKQVINNFFTIIDYSRLDIINFRVYFKLSYFSEEKFNNLMDYICSSPHVSWVATSGGRYDLICTFLASNPSQFNKILKSFIAKFPKQLQDYNVLTTIVVRWFGRKYLSKTPPPEIIFGGDREPISIDELDLKILDHIAEDARKSSVKIGKDLSISPKTVIQRIKNLSDLHIIKGFKPLLSPQDMQCVSTLLMIRYHSLPPDKEDELIYYLKEHPNVISLAKILGRWDLEIRIETNDIMEFRKMEVDIRRKFTLLIQQIESIPLYKTYKNNYFPKFLIEKH